MSPCAPPVPPWCTPRWEGGTMTSAFIHAPALLATTGLTVLDGLDGVDKWPRLVEPTLSPHREEFLYTIFL